MFSVVLAVALCGGVEQKSGPVQKADTPYQKGVSVQVDVAGCYGDSCAARPLRRVFQGRHLRRAGRVLVRTPRVFVRVRGRRGCG